MPSSVPSSKQPALLRDAAAALMSLPLTTPKASSTCRPDLVGFVNGLPWVVIELKKPGVPARAAFDENLTHYKQQVPALFWSNALLIASNGTSSRVGSLTADWERWVEWKRIEREDEPRRVSLEVMLRGTCDPTRLRNKVEYTSLPAYLLPEEFTLSELQHMYEIVMERPVEKSAFRTRVLGSGLLTPAGDKMREGPNRPAQLYRLTNPDSLVVFPRTFNPRRI